MHLKSIVVRVAGVTYNNRQNVLAQMTGDEPCMIVPEPENKYDPNALAVWVSLKGERYHVGYVPREIAAEIAPLLEGEKVIATLRGIVGGFTTYDGETASLGLRIGFEYPSDEGDL